MKHQAIEALDMKQYQPGKKIEVKRSKNNNVSTQNRKTNFYNSIGKVVAVYPHHVLLDMGHYKASFQRTLIALGIEHFKEV